MLLKMAVVEDFNVAGGILKIACIYDDLVNYWGFDPI